METSPAAAALPVAVRPDVSDGTRLRGRRLALARVGWGILVALALSFFIVAVPAGYRRYSAPPEAVRAFLSQRGLSLGVYAAYSAALMVVFAAGNFAVAAVIARR